MQECNQSPKEFRMELLQMIRLFLARFAITFKLATILILVLVLLIPLGMIGSVLQERIERRNEAVGGITATWGGSQDVVGPVLVIPYQYHTKALRDQVVGGKVTTVEVDQTQTAYIDLLPNEMIVDGEVTPNEVHRGIYDAIVYKGKFKISGSYPAPDLGELGIAPGDVQWGGALVTMAVSDLRGTSDMAGIKVGGKDCAFRTGCKLAGYNSGVNARVTNLAAGMENMPFELNFDLKGSQGLSFAPVGQRNRVALKSPWPAPNFRGAALPSERSVGAKGFSALWEVSYFGRNYPQQSVDRGGNAQLNPAAVAPSMFGVDFMNLIDSYRLVERATKYGILFIVLIFTAFFLFEMLGGLKIHTIQYTLIGVALCLFYLAVLSLSEFINFLYAYWIGAAAASALIVLYSLAVLKSGRRTAIVATALAAVYGYLYVVLQLQNYSLLFGTAGLFVVLGIVMYATRNIDWLTRDLKVAETMGK